MRGRLLGLMLAGSLTCGGASLAAHHAFSKTYRSDAAVTIDGVLMALVYRNPHSFLEITAPDDSGRPRRWAVEWGSSQLVRRTLTSGELQPGDRLIVTGDISRDQAAWRLRLRTIVRPSDGWRWSEAAR